MFKLEKKNFCACYKWLLLLLKITPVKNKELFWVKMIDIQKGLGVKNIPQFIRQEMTLERKDLTKEQENKYIKSEGEISRKPTDNFKFKYARSDIMEKVIKNC